jgi:glutamyl-tRNA synthetase
VDKGRVFLSSAVTYDEAALAKHVRQPGMRDHLQALHDAYVATASFTREALERALRSVAEARGVKAGALIHAARVAVTGGAVSPGLFETFELLGRERVLERLAAVAGSAPFRA